jgi:hypothetical protein
MAHLVAWLDCRLLCEISSYCRSARVLRIRRWNSGPGGCADKTLGYSKAGRAVMIKILAIEFIENGVKHHRLIVNGDNGVGWDRHPVVCGN